MLLWTSALRSRGEAAAQGAVPLSRMPVYQRRRAEHVHADGARRVPLCERRAQDLHPQRSRSAGDARALRELRHASDAPAAGPTAGDPKGRNARRPEPLRRAADGHLHARQAALSYDSGRCAGVRARAAALVWASASAQNPSGRPTTVVCSEPSPKARCAARLTLSIVTAAISRLRSTSHSGVRRSSWIWTSCEAILAEVSKRSG